MSTYKQRRQPPKSWIKLVDGWILDMHARSLSDKTIESYWYRLTQFAIYINTHPKQVQASDIQAWLANDGLEPSTRAGRRAAINEFYKWAVRNNKLKRNPVDYIPGVKRPIKPAKQPAPESAVAQGIYSPDIHVQLMVQLSAEAGLRREEIAKVKGSDVIEYRDSNESRFALSVHGKGRKERVVPINAQFARQIRDIAGDGYLFPGRFGGHVCVDHVYRVIKHATGYATHSFRRRFGRVGYEESDHNIRAIQELLGHNSVATTQSYIWVPPAELATITSNVRARRPEPNTTE